MRIAFVVGVVFLLVAVIAAANDIWRWQKYGGDEFAELLGSDLDPYERILNLLALYFFTVVALVAGTIAYCAGKSSAKYLVLSACIVAVLQSVFFWMPSPSARHAVDGDDNIQSWRTAADTLPPIT